MKLLITGATGFIGSNLTTYLSRKGNDIAVLLRQNSTTTPLSGCLDQIKCYRTDGSFSDLVKILEDFNPKVVIHLASLFLTQHTPEQSKALFESNILFPARLLEAMAVCGKDKLINTGTSWQHYENAPYNPVNLYAATKQAFEDMCEYYTQDRKIRIITLKLFETYGPYDERKKLIPLLLKSLTRKQYLKLSPGEQKLDFVHVQDICAAYEAAANQIRSKGQVGQSRYGLSSGHHTSLRELVGTIEKISGEKLPILWGGQSYRNREIFYPWSEFTPLPFWKPKIPLEQGLRPLILEALN